MRPTRFLSSAAALLLWTLAAAGSAAAAQAPTSRPTAAAPTRAADKVGALDRAADAIRPPRLELGEWPYPGQEFLLRVRIKHFPGVRANIDRTSISTTSPNCAFHRIPDIAYGTKERDGDGTLAFAISGVWRTGSFGWGISSCGLRVRITPEQQDGSEMPQLTLTGSLSVPVPVKVTVSETWALKDFFSVGLLRGQGACDGTSIGPESYPVGIRKHENDLSLAIRSGPLATICTWGAGGWLLPEGVRITRMRWRLITSGPDNRCGFSSASTLVETLLALGYPFYMDRGPKLGKHVELDDSSSTGMANNHLFIDNRSGDLEQNGQTWQDVLPKQIGWFFEPLYLSLGCDVTGWNDHGVRAVLEEVEYEGPPGAVLRR